jgi:hypothetical protein
MRARVLGHAAQTDCRSLAATRTLGLTDVLTNDHHSTQEGFTMLFP